MSVSGCCGLAVRLYPNCQASSLLVQDGSGGGAGALSTGAGRRAGTDTLSAVAGARSTCTLVICSFLVSFLFHVPFSFEAFCLSLLVLTGEGKESYSASGGWF